MTKMYIICRYSLVDDKRRVCDTCQDPAEAYEKAHEFDAILRFGRSDEDTYLADMVNEPFVIRIEDEHGQSAWRECCGARCPSDTNRLFQK